MRFDTEGAARSSLQPSLCERYRSLFNFPTMIPNLPDQHPKCMRHKECINPTRKIGTHNFRHNHTISSKKRQFPPPAVLPHPINNQLNKSLPREKKTSRKIKGSPTPSKEQMLCSQALVALSSLAATAQAFRFTIWLGDKCTISGPNEKLSDEQMLVFPQAVDKSGCLVRSNAVTSLFFSAFVLTECRCLEIRLDAIWLRSVAYDSS
jgi:hypothetical protein